MCILAATLEARGTGAPAVAVPTSAKPMVGARRHRIVFVEEAADRWRPPIGRHGSVPPRRPVMPLIRP